MDKDGISKTRKQAAIYYKTATKTSDVELVPFSETIDEIEYVTDYKPDKGRNNDANFLNTLVTKLKLTTLKERYTQPNKVAKLYIAREKLTNELEIAGIKDTQDGFAEPILGFSNGEQVITGMLTYDPLKWGDEVEIEFHTPGVPLLNYNEEISDEPKDIAWELPRYRTTPTYGKADNEFIEIYRNLLVTGKYPDIAGDPHEDAAQFIRRFKELAEIQKKFYYGTGYYDKQLRRKLVVEEQARILGRKENRSYKHYREYMDVVFPLDTPPMKFMSNDCQEWQKAWAELGHEDSLFRLNMSADSGPWSLSSMKMAKVGITLAQNDLLTQWLFENIEKNVPTEIWDWAGLSVLKAKAEIYQRKPPKEKDYIRNYSVYNTWAMRGINAFMKCFDTAEKEWDGAAIVMSGDVIFKGKLDELLKKMITNARDNKKPSYAVYSDNLTIVVLDKLGNPYLISLDGSKFESCIKKDLMTFEIQRMVEIFLEKGGTMTKQFKKYLIDIVPRWSTEFYSILETQQFKNNHMGSGTPGTFRWNTALMCRVVFYLRQNEFSYLEDLLNYDEETKEYTFTAQMIETFSHAGTKLTVESVVRMDDTTSDVLRVDILGFDCIPLAKPSESEDWLDRVFYAPQLSYERFLKTMNFVKSKLLNTTSKEKLFLVKFVINLSRMRSAYILYGWRDPYWSFLIQKYMAHLKNEMALYINQIKQKLETEDIQEVITSIHTQMKLIMEEVGIVDQYAGMVNSQTMEDLNIPTMFQTYELIIGLNGRDEFIKSVIDEGKIDLIYVVDVDNARIFGIQDEVLNKHKKRTEAIWQGIMEHDETAPESSIVQNLNLLFKNEKKAKYEKPKPIQRTHVKSAVIDYNKNRTTKVSDDTSVVFRLNEILRKAVSKLHVLVPVPQQYRSAELSQEEIRKVVWDRLYKDIQHTFNIGDVEMKATKTRLAKCIIPHWLTPPDGFTIVNWEEWRTTKSQMQGQEFQLEYNGYTHDLFIREMTTLDPRIDFIYYTTFGYQQEFVEQAILSNQPLDTSEPISGMLRNKNTKVKVRKEVVSTKLPKKKKKDKSQSVEEVQPYINIEKEPIKKSKSVTWAAKVKETTIPRTFNEIKIEVKPNETRVETIRRQRQERRNKKFEKPEIQLGVRTLDIRLQGKEQQKEWLTRRYGVTAANNISVWMDKRPNSFISKYFEDFVKDPYGLYKKLVSNSKLTTRLEKALMYVLKLVEFKDTDPIIISLLKQSAYSTKGINELRRAVHDEGNGIPIEGKS